MSSSTSALKARHYSALVSSLRRLQQDLAESEQQMDRLSEHLVSMQKMGTHSAAQYVRPSGLGAALTCRFMAVSRLLDRELIGEEDKRTTEEATTPTGA